jgi:PleD family two-component response regulator
MQDTIALIDRETFLLLLTNIKAGYAQETCCQIREIIETTTYGIDDYRIMVNVDYELHNFANGSDIIQNLTKIS